MSEVLGAFPPTHEEPYHVAISRHLGELQLAGFAASYNREFIWTYDAGKSLWTHHPAPHWENEEWKDGKFVSGQWGMAIPRALLMPETIDSSFYHIHPVIAESMTGVEVKNQLPSNEDIAASARLCINGYRDSRIVTDVGVTTVTFAPKVIRDKSVEAKGFTLTHEQIEDWLRVEGTIGAIHKAFEFYTNNLNGLVRLNFSEHDA